VRADPNMGDLLLNFHLNLTFQHFTMYAIYCPISVTAMRFVTVDFKEMNE